MSRGDPPIMSSKIPMQVQFFKVTFIIVGWLFLVLSLPFQDLDCLGQLFGLLSQDFVHILYLADFSISCFMWLWYVVLDNSGSLSAETMSLVGNTSFTL